MGNKIITEEDFWICSGGAVPAPFQTTQLSTKKASGHKYITVEDKSTLSWVDFGCRKLMLIMAIIAAVVVVAVVATGGAALAVVVAAGAAAGAAGAAYGAVLGALICGQKAAVARKWLGSKKDLIIQGQKAITGDHKMACAVFGETITFAPKIKNWWQAIALGTANYIEGIMEGMLAGSAIGLGGGLLAGGSSALAAGGLRGLGQAGLQALKSMPRNLLGNVLESFGKAGLAMRGFEGITNVLSEYGKTGKAGIGDFLSGVVSEETDAYKAVRNIVTGQGTWQDAANLAMLFAPGDNKPNNSNSSGNGQTDAAPTDAPDNSSPAPDAQTNPTDETNTPPVSQSADAATPPPVAEFDAFEGGPARPTTPTAAPDAQTIRDNVLRNVEASRRARESSNFGGTPPAPGSRSTTKADWKAQEQQRRLGNSPSPQMRNKILNGERVANPNSSGGMSNRIIGGHSPSIKTDPNYAHEVISNNPDGTTDVRFITQFPDGNLSQIKRSTLAPDHWSDQRIIHTTNTVGNTPPVATRARDGATLHRQTIDGVQWEVIKDSSGNITSSYPTGGNPTQNF